MTLAQGDENRIDDRIQHQISEYASELSYDAIAPEAVHAAKLLLVDTLGSLLGGFFGEPCRIVRGIAAQLPNPDGATILGTRMKCAPDMAAFVNGTTARYLDFNDTYQWPGSYSGHPSDMLTTILAAAEHERASGREFITAVVLAYEVYLRVSDVFSNRGWDYTNLVCLGGAVAACKLMGLTRNQISHCVSMAIVPNNALNVTRLGHRTMFRSLPTGYAGRAGIFAAQLARAGMQGPHQPFEGKAGWCDHIAQQRFALETMGGNGVPFKILDTDIKLRPAGAYAIPPILAAEKVAPLANSTDVQKVIVEVNRRTKEHLGVGEHHWHPDSRETADHSIPYVVAAALMNGTVDLRSFDDAHLWNPELRALMQKITLVENDEFTKLCMQLPQRHHARVTVVMSDGRQLVGATGSDQDDPRKQRSDARIGEKFRGLSEDLLGAKQVSAILNRLWHLEDLDNVAAIPPQFVLD